MKKLFSIVVALLAITAAQAANTEVVLISLTGQGGSEASNVVLRVDPSISADETSSYFGVSDEVGQVNIYALKGASQYSAIKSSAISELELQVITNRRAAANQHYTLTFNVPTLTEGLTLYDSKTGEYKAITNGATYEFEVNTTLHADYVEGTNYVVANRFFINHAAPAVPGICNNYDKLQITGYAGAQLEVLNYADKASVFTETVAGDNVEIDLEAKGLTANTQYFVKLTPAGATAALEYVIKFKPAVTVVP